MHDRKNSRFICLTSKQMILHFSSGHRISHMSCDRGLFTFWTCIHRNLARLKTTLADKRTLPDHLVDYLGQPDRQILEYVSDKDFWKRVKIVTHSQNRHVAATCVSLNSNQLYFELLTLDF